MKIAIINKGIEEYANKKRNLGIEILRMFLCFRIVLLHYYSSNNIFILSLKINRFQVPCFFFISFYFLYSTILQRNIQKFRLRLERLLVPYIMYPIINWSINNLMFLLIKFNRYNGFLSLQSLKTQILVGRGIYGIAILWFHFNLIIFTLFFFIFSCLLKKYFLSFFQIVAVISYTLQYSGANYLFFIQYSENIWMSIGNLIETFPISIFAFTLASNNYYQFLLEKRKKYIFFSFWLFYLLSNYKIFTIIRGFSSTGIQQIFKSFFLFTFFILLPLDNLNHKLLTMLKQISKYTQGIYCLHFLIQYYLKLIIDKNGSFFGCIILYILAYFTSLIGYKIFAKTKLKFLFI